MLFTKTKLMALGLSTSVIFSGGMMALADSVDSDAEQNTVDVILPISDEIETEEGFSNVSVFSETTPEARTKAKVRFEIDNSPVPPDRPEVVDPTDPEGGPKPVDPGTPEDGGGSGGNGTRAFNINWVSHFNFGTIKLTGQNIKQYAKPVRYRPLQGNEVNELAPFIQITDHRGTNAGWSLTANASEFYDDKDKNEVLKGAQIVLGDGVLLDSTQFDQSESALQEGPKVFDGVEIIGNGSQLVLNANEGKGAGVWTVAYGGHKDSTNPKERAKLKDGHGVHFTLPMNVKPKLDASYTSDIVWTLGATPA